MHHDGATFEADTLLNNPQNKKLLQKFIKRMSFTLQARHITRVWQHRPPVSMAPYVVSPQC